MMKNIKEKQAGEKRGRAIYPKIFGLLIIVLGLIIISMSFVSAVTNITNCQTLSSANTEYALNISISNDSIAADCINITAQNINQINLNIIKNNNMYY